MGDVREYISPVTQRPVDGRRARREDLARSGCREVDPSEAPGGKYDIAPMRNPNFDPIVPEVKY